MLEAYLDGAANVKDFSHHVINHTDPTEFVPLHATLIQRMNKLSALKVGLRSTPVSYNMCICHTLQLCLTNIRFSKDSYSLPSYLSFYNQQTPVVFFF